MQKSISSLVLRVVLVLLVVLWHVPTAAQSTCPELKVSDFKVNYYAANADCGTDGQIIVTYRNNVAGFSKLTYETSTDGATWANPVEQTSLSVPTTIPLTGWAAGQTIHLRVTGTCPSGTQEVVFSPLTHRSEQPHAVAPVFETTPAGGCSATAGSIGVSVGAVTGFTKAEYLLYQGTTLLNSMTSNTPYAESTFYNLPSGTYKVVMRATPACTPASPGATFKNGAYEVEQTVKVGYFSILPTPIPTRGTACAGGVRVAVARVMGVNGLKYEVLPSGGGAALQTEQLVYPNFTHTFLNLPSGNYELRATSDCGTVETVPFTVPIGGAGTLSASALQGTYAHCSIGKISATVPGTSVACPVDYTLTPNGGGAPTTQLGVTEESAVFEGLAPGNYTISATWAGQTQSVTAAVPIVSLGDLKVTATRADYFCDPTGTLKVELENGVYLDNSTLILYNEGTPVRTLSLSKTDRTKTLSGLVPGAYSFTLRTNCGEEITAVASLGTKHLVGGAMNLWVTKQKECEEGQPYSLTFSDNFEMGKEPDDWKHFLQGATYEITDPATGQMLASGVWPAKAPINTYGQAGYVMNGIRRSTSNNLKLSLSPSCGTPKLNFTYTLPRSSIISSSASLYYATPYSPECEGLGGMRISFTNITANKSYRLVVKKEGVAVPVYTTTFNENGTYYDENLSELLPGKYTYEVFACSPEILVNSGDFEISSTPKFANYQVGKKNATEIQELAVYFQYALPANTKVTLTGSGGTTQTVTSRYATSSFSFTHLPYEIYTLSVTYPSAGCPTVSTTYPTFSTTPPSPTPGNSNINLQLNFKWGDFCTNNSQLEANLSVYPAGSSYGFTGGVTYQVYDWENNTLLDTKTSTNPEDKVLFTNLPTAAMRVVATTPLGQVLHGAFTPDEFRGNIWNPVNYNIKNMPQNATIVEAAQNYPGCQKGGYIDITSKLLDMSFAQKPTKIYLEKNTGYYSSTIVDSIVSPNIIERGRFENLDDAEYAVYYYYCGVPISTEKVTIATVYNVNLQMSAQPPAPCQDGTINITGLPYDRNLVIDYVVTHKATGIQVKSGKINAASPKIEDIPQGDYLVKIKVHGPCLEFEKESEVKIGDVSWYLSTNYSYRLSCQSNGWISARLYEGTFPQISKIEYTLQPSGGGTPQTAHTIHPTEETKFTGLLPGTYKLTAKATCQRDGASTPTFYVQEQDFTLSNGYPTPLTAVQDPSGHVASSNCPLVGALGLTIQGGNSNDQSKLHVYILENPSGPLATPQEIKKAPYPYPNNSWGGNLAPGNYKLQVWDECMRITIPNLTVPALPTPTPVASITQCVWKTMGCNMKTEIKLNFPSLSRTQQDAYVRSFKDKYEVAIVPTGGNRTADPWSSSTNYYTGGSSYDSDITFRDSFPTFNIAAGGDILIRLKDCPGTMWRTHFNTAQECPPRIDIYGSSNVCANEITFYIQGTEERNLSYCKKFDLIVRRGYYNLSGPIVAQQTFEVSNANLPSNWSFESSYYYYLNDLKQLNDDDYTLYAYDHETSTWIGYAAVRKADKVETKFKYSIGPQTTDCYGETLSWTVQTSCSQEGYIVVYDADVVPNVELDRSSKLIPSNNSSNPWRSKIRYVRGKNYRLDYVDKHGNTLLKTPQVHKVEYSTPTAYSFQDIVYGTKCYKNSRGLHDYAHRAAWPTGVPHEQKRMIPIQKIECRNNNTGEVFYPEFVEQTQDTQFTGGGSITMRNWKVRKPDGTVSNASQYSLGNYTFTVTEQCGAPKTGTFKVTNVETAIFEPRDPTVTMDCDGKFHITPNDRAYFASGAEPVTMLNYYLNDGTGQRKNWGQAFETYNATPTYTPYYSFQDGSQCEGPRRTLDLTRYFLNFDGAQSLTYYCSNSNRGVITIGLKSGHPPYKYILKKPDGSIVDTHDHVNGATTFYTGQLGETYRIEATDACGLTSIYQDVKIQDPADIGYAMSREVYFCEGEQLTYDPINLTGATYSWTGPNGFSSTNRQLNFTATANRAGTYLLKVLPSSCTTTIDATIKVHVVKVQEVPTTTSARVCAGQTATINIGAPTVVSDGLPSTLHKYQWQINDDLSNANGWKGIAGATSEQLTYAPPYTGTYHVRRVTVLGNCSGISGVSTITVDPGMTQTVSNEELNVTIDHKNPFTLTAGLLSGSPTRSYQWQRSLDKTSWTNIASATNETFTETQRYGSTVYYKRVTTSGTCVVESPIITVRFKKRYPAMVNPHLRQRVLTE